VSVKLESSSRRLINGVMARLVISHIDPAVGSDVFAAISKLVCFCSRREANFWQNIFNFLRSPLKQLPDQDALRQSILLLLYKNAGANIKSVRANERGLRCDFDEWPDARLSQKLLSQPTSLIILRIYTYI
jgi:hypothetical protein